MKGASAAVGVAPLVAVAQAQEGAGGPRILDSDEPVQVRFTLNGVPATLTVDTRTTLVEALREQAGLTGTKVGCGHGACGACTVMKDARTVSSCLTLAVDVEGSHITTIEGLSRGDVLHPVQQAFIDADALQCGFCTPGIVMSSVAYSDGWKRTHGHAEPPHHDVCEALSGNLCRCGAQAGILAATKAACTGKRAEPLRSPTDAGRVALPRFDGREKVTGAARYSVDQFPKGVLYGEIVRSTFAHARIKEIDVTPALAMPGVKAALVLLPRQGERFTTVRFVGLELAAVAADSPRRAQEAARAVRVVYDVQRAAVDRDDALAPDAPLVFAESVDKPPSAAEGIKIPEAVFTWKGNTRGPMRWPLHIENAEVDAKLAAARLKVDYAFETIEQVHTALEPHGCVAHWQDGYLDVWTPTQTVEQLQSDLAEALDVPAARVRVHSEYVGGAFGAKCGLKPEQLAAVKLARVVKAPVRIVLSRADELMVGGHRPGTRQRVRAGIADGARVNVLSHEMQAYAGIAVGERAVGISNTLYPIETIHEHDVNVLTHTPPACAFRAPAAPPRAFAVEQTIDELAARLGVDPLLMRLYQEPRSRRAGVIKLARDRFGDTSRLVEVARDKGRFVRGVGCAIAEWFVAVSPTASVELRAFRDGTVRLSTAAHDMGNGARSFIAQMLHDELGLPAAKMDIRVGDSSLPTSIGAFGSMTTPSVAPALMQAIDQLKQALAGNAQPRIQGAVAERNGLRAGARFHSFASLLKYLRTESFLGGAKRGGDVDGFALPPPPLDQLPLSAFALSRDNASSAQIAEVEVDRLLGRVRVLRVVVAIDAGRIINPVTAASQVAGGVIQGVSGVLYEGRRLDVATGRLLSRNLETYALIGIADVPAIDIHFLPQAASNVPYGAVGLAENATVATGPAVANAIFRATGRRVFTSPVTPARLLAALG